MTVQQIYDELDEILSMAESLKEDASELLNEYASLDDEVKDEYLEDRIYDVYRSLANIY